MSNSEFDTDQHHKQRKIDKKKRHHAGYSDDTKETRKARVGFKNYLKDLEAKELEEMISDEDDTI